MLSIGRWVLGSVSASKKRQVCFAMAYSTCCWPLLSPLCLLILWTVADAVPAPARLPAPMATHRAIPKITCFNFKIILLDKNTSLHRPVLYTFDSTFKQTEILCTRG